MRRLYLSVLIVLLATGTLFANGGADEVSSAGVEDGLTRIVIQWEGHAGDEGTPQEVITKLNTSLAGGGLNGQQVDEMTWKVNYTTALEQACLEKGVAYTGVMSGWGEQLTQKQLNAFLAKSGPDVFVGETQMPGFARKGYLEAFPADLAEKVRQECVKGAYSPMEVDGKIYGLASYPGVNVLFWNKDLLRKAGLDPEKAPETWDEWLEMAAAITEAGNGEFYGGGTYAGPNFGGSLRVGPFMMMAGGGFIDENGDVAFNTPGNIETMEFMRELAKNSPAGIVGGAGEGGWWDAFSRGEIAYVVDGPWRLGAGQSVGIDVGYSVLPMPEGGTAANVTIGAAFFGVPTYSKNKEYAFAFIESMFDKRVQDTIRDLGYRPAVLLEYADDAEYTGSYIGTFWETLQGDVSGLPTFKGDQNAKIWDLFHQSMTQAIVTDGDIVEILDKAQDLAEGL